MLITAATAVVLPTTAHAADGTAAEAAVPAAATAPPPPAHAAARPTPGKYAVPAGCNVGHDTGQGDDGNGTSHARCFADGLADAKGRLVQQDDEPLPTSLGPADIKQAYDLPSGGDGRTVAIVDAFGYGSAESDLAVFRAHYGLPACTTENGCFTKVDQRGGTDYPTEDPGWSIETALDLDAVSAACPGCHILLVQADNNGSPNLGQGVDTAARLGAAAISNSYGVDGEFPYESYYDHYYDHPGIAVTVSTGDSGHVQSYPATAPDVIAVGGTTLNKDSSSPRGWTETAWASGGSGCSLYEPAPGFQQDIATGCHGNRATADVAADADSESGLAVYNTLGQDGWAQWGGTSLASPLVAAMYALAGPAVPGTYPASYVYREKASLHDVTDGTNDNCGDNSCTAGPGWDGPTGVGTPNGVSALTLGPSADVTGKVTADHKALPGATVTLTGPDGYAFHGVTDSHGRYDVAVAAGTYRMTVSDFGYDGGTLDGVTVKAGDSVTRTADLRKLATRTVSGTVHDASGQGWPVYAKITVKGDPNGTAFTDPFTGRYSLRLPVGTSYTLSAAPVDMPGYHTATATVDLGSGSGTITHDIGLGVDPSTCTAAGYGYTYGGAGTDFEGWSAERDGWSVTDDAGNGKTWVFDDPGQKGNLTGGSGQFAIVDDWYHPAAHDTSLVTPKLDFTHQTQPRIGFDTYYFNPGFGTQAGYVELSLDGGATWQKVWTAPDTTVQGQISVPVPQAAGKSDVKVRFRFVGDYDNYWEIDNVFAGSRSCDPVAGGLVAGQVTDANTGGPLTGAEVSMPGGTPAVTRTTKDDPALGDGFYWLFAPGTDGRSTTAAGRHYTTATAKVTPRAHAVVDQDWALRAGQVTAGPASISVRSGNGSSKTSQTNTLTLTNTGTGPATVNIVEQDRGFTPQGGKHQDTSPGAPLKHTKVKASSRPFGPGHVTDAGALPPKDASVNPAWSDLPDYPTPIMDNVVAEHDGTVYSVSGFADSGITADGAAYDPSAGKWRAIAPMPQARENAMGGFVNGKLYVTGGWDAQGDPTSTTYVYDPAKNSWSHVADMPAPATDAAAAVVGGRLYVVGGCSTFVCDTGSSVYRYDPRTDAWTRLADYPQDEVLLGCAASGDGLVCAGGIGPVTNDPTGATYQYAAGSDTWKRLTDMPVPTWGMGYAGAGGKLQMVGGVATYDATNRAEEFDPATGVWSALPNATYALFRGGAACGLTRVGGGLSSAMAAPYAEALPGQDACATGSDVGWLSTSRTRITVPAGKTVTVQVRTDASATSTPGTNQARLAFVTDTPYTIPPVNVALTTR
ncbi:carboxypeptidase regulatory-like domain-containing protein [Streptomyces sp. NPDC048106]|uniref:carboxypeptidase regulatory-like domain-containing protein n=1 Tax=Streptomyces sp. NPDC048106 TaxID=3155750 RepID=UPI003454EF10